jgi:hypothetical protein
MPRLLFWLWATVVAIVITPIVFAVGIFVAREFGPFMALILSLIAWAYVAAMAYVGFRAIGEMVGHQ